MRSKSFLGLATFFAIAFGVPWMGWTILKDSGLPYWLAPCFCSLAGFAASYVEGGFAGLRAFVARTCHLRGAGKSLIFAVLLPLVLGSSYLLVSGADLHGAAPSFRQGFGQILLLGLVTGPLAEEFGWRGYLQAKLIGPMRRIPAAILTALVWCAWHAPLFASSVFSKMGSALGFIAFCITWSIFLLYVVERANGSVWPAVILHWMINAHSSILGGLFPSVDRSLLPGGSASAGCYGIAAVLFVLANLQFYLRRPQPVALPA